MKERKKERQKRKEVKSGRKEARKEGRRKEIKKEWYLIQEVRTVLQLFELFFRHSIPHYTRALDPQYVIALVLEGSYSV